MAAAIIPIITSLLPLAAQIIPEIVQGIDGLFPPKTGEQKLPAALDATKSALDKVISSLAAGTVSMPDDATLRGMIEQAVQQMKAGRLPVAGAPVVVPDGAPFTVEQAWVIRPRDVSVAPAKVQVTGGTLSAG